ncbi:hypothetical protein BDZ45DRAFT_747409 [Acephala macrosclerotiorum]|nr:hypothetical protein BDZ45DRAFT_747409 [Acephala macrosclerotiorum]
MEMTPNDSFRLLAAFMTYPTTHAQLKRTRAEFELALHDKFDRIVLDLRKKRPRKRSSGNKHPTQFLTSWANRQRAPVDLKVRDCPGTDGLTKWFAQIYVLKKRFVTPKSSRTMVKARRQASDLACWWIFYGRQLYKAGLMSMEEYSSSPELASADAEALVIFPEPEISQNSRRTLSTSTQSISKNIKTTDNEKENPQSTFTFDLAFHSRRR